MLGRSGVALARGSPAARGTPTNARRVSAPSVRAAASGTEPAAGGGVRVTTRSEKMEFQARQKQVLPTLAWACASKRSAAWCARCAPPLLHAPPSPLTARALRLTSSS